ncbi:MAG: nucleotide-binding protein [Candidatus Parvarchaeota archaeon]|nr:nucleotide-binding protein [Candidatus Jingweiarchaeum tengchongense]MCW1297667.1 nucleotide-binding protein [Candidatus Jingweiarchaeum tengchongense]MCW1299678.1 nucleotide-binding protein [Candidatus Jingweiarchaeum tengchongense]MCW1304354.1 nucleotide-binding protein [Candidatus Jingweiarchaeum tengchongense]MCW1305663.1 nucleotide-binding protein [Candidatus Jingweiarchaeum tengchongense]
MEHVLLDTNFLLVPFRFKVDIFSEFERIIDKEFDLWILDVCLKELKKITKEIEFKSIMELIKKKGVKIKETKEKIRNIDDLIIKFARENNCIIATNDKSLRKTAMGEGLHVIYLRKKKFLEIL